jgi:hypothetical protein
MHRHWRAGWKCLLVAGCTGAVASILGATFTSASFAQAPPTCPQQPQVTISPTLPLSVCIPAQFNDNPIVYFDDFSWRSFIAMVWPVEQGQRGVPSKSQTIGPVSGPLVFETLKADWEIFQPSPGPNTDPPKPADWNSYTGANPCGTSGPQSVGFGDLLLAAFSKYGNLGQAGFGRLVNALPAQNGTYTRYFTAYNQVTFDQIVQQGLYLRSNFPPAPPPQQPGLQFSLGAVTIKAAWMDMTGVQNPERYYTRSAWMLNPFASPPTCSQVTVGLVGLHIVQKTRNQPQWVWSTFEHVDNVPLPGPPQAGPFAYSACTSAPGADCNQQPANSPIAWNDIPNNPDPHAFCTKTPTPCNVQRSPVGINPSTQNINQTYQQELQKRGGPWQFYQLVMTQWPVPQSGTADTPVPATQSGEAPFTFPGSSSGFNTSAWANVTLETFDQRSVFNSCMACHTTVQTKSDFIYSLNINAYPSTLSPPSETLRALRQAPTAVPAARELSPELSSLRQLMESRTAR